MKQEYYRLGLVFLFLVTLISIGLTILFWRKLQSTQQNITAPGLFPDVSIPIEDVSPQQPSDTPQATVPILEDLTTPECKRAGWSNQLCVDAAITDIVTTCEFRAEYACYQQARCERQADGQCGFTQTEELRQCLLDASVPR